MRPRRHPASVAGAATVSAAARVDTDDDLDGDGAKNWDDTAPEDAAIQADADGDGVDDDADAYPYDRARSTQPVMIVLPKNGSVHYTLRTTVFAGMAFDPNDSPGTGIGDWLDGEKLTWTSSIDGAIGQGMKFHKPLSAGTHVIRLTARLQGGDQVAQVTITVKAGWGPTNAPPVAKITSPFDEMPVNRNRFLFVRGTATDATDGEITGPVIRLQNARPA